jgi:hypothetical protein
MAAVFAIATIERNTCMMTRATIVGTGAPWAPESGTAKKVITKPNMATALIDKYIKTYLEIRLRVRGGRVLTVE